MSVEEKDLATHVEICAIRYQGIQEKITGVERRLDAMEDTVASIKNTMTTNFNEIKLLIERQNNSRTIQIIATIGTVAAAALGLIGYMFHR
jgi:pantothenate kinase